MVLIDTSVFIAVERGRISLEDPVFDTRLAMSAITLSELLHGVHRADSESRRAARGTFVERLASQMPILPIDEFVARVHARVKADLQRQGVVIGAHDLLIGCTALANGGKVLTRDLKSFPEIPGLELVTC